MTLPPLIPARGGEPSKASPSSLPEGERRSTSKPNQPHGRTRVASKESQQIVDLYKSWVAAFGANPEMGVDEMRRMFERWGDITGEPGGVDYIEVDAGGVPALWAAP